MEIECIEKNITHYNHDVLEIRDDDKRVICIRRSQIPTLQKMLSRFKHRYWQGRFSREWIDKLTDQEL